jgi:glycosyltransferase involved in cell wall biosynthesis
MLSWEYPPRIVGGISRVVHDLAQKLGEKNDEVHVITCWEPGAKEIEKDKNVFVHRVRTCDVNTVSFVDWVLQLNFALVEQAVKIISEMGKFDIIHGHDWLVAFAAKTIKYAYSMPIVATMHATEYGRNWGIHNDTQRYINNVEQWFAFEATNVIVNSEYMKNESINIFQLPSEKIKVISNGINTEKFDLIKKDMEFRKKYAMDDEKIVLFVGRIVNEKGVHVLIDAIPKVISFCPKTKFVIAGKGPQLDYLKWKVWNSNTNENVHFTGYIKDEDLLSLYKCVDLAVFPSLYEPFGIVVLEGMVAKVPVVVSDTGGLSGIVEHGVDGLKAYTGNANSLADCIIEILSDPEKADKIRKNAYEKVCRLYNWNKITEMTMDVYHQTIDESNKKNWMAPSIKESLRDQ